MKYQYVANSGNEYTISTAKDSHYSGLSINKGSRTIYANSLLPILDGSIKMEENLERIAMSVIDYHEKGE